MNWKEFRETVRTGSREESVNALIEVARTLQGTAGFRHPLPPPDSDDEQHLASVLRQMIDGQYVEVGPAPQGMLAMLVALHLLAQDMKVFLFSGLSLGWENPAQSPLPGLRERMHFQPDIQWEEPGESRPYHGQLIFADYAGFLQRTLRDENRLEGQDCAAVFCEADLCLYDRRLVFADDGNLRAIGALYEGEEGSGTWYESPDFLDARDALQQFSMVCPITSHTSERVRRELLEAYGSVLGGQGETRKNVTIPAVAYRTHREKTRALAEDADAAGGPSLVFFLEARTRDLLENALSGQGLTTQRLTSMKQTFAFIDNANDGEVGLFPGLPALERDKAPRDKPLFNVFIAEHYPFEHHHQKIFAFCSKHLRRRYGPYFYLSLEDAVTAVFPREREHFRKTFGVIETSEKWLSAGKSIRKWAAWLILRKLYAQRSKRFGNKVPILMAEGAFHQEPEKLEPTKTSIRNQLEGSCFCGSGKPFAECHGGERGVLGVES